MDSEGGVLDFDHEGSEFVPERHSCAARRGGNHALPLLHLVAGQR